MQMLDYFIDPLSKTLKYTEVINSGKTLNYEKTKDKIEKSILQKIKKSGLKKYSKEEIRLALYAVSSFIDETIINSSWKYKNEWKKKPLIKKYFKTTNFGTGFYIRLNSLDENKPVDNEIRQVFCYCLKLGFKGILSGSDNQIKLDEITKKNINLLMPENSYGIISQESEKLFPDAYLAASSHMSKPPGKDFNFLIFIIPVFVFFALYFILNNNLEKLADYLVTVI